MIEIKDPAIDEVYTTDQMDVLRDLLDQECIEWHPDNTSMFARTQGIHDGRIYSVVFGFGSYGYRAGLLEVDIDGLETDEPIGWLKAEEVRDLITGKLNEREAERRAEANYQRYNIAPRANTTSQTLSLAQEGI